MYKTNYERIGLVLSNLVDTITAKDTDYGGAYAEAVEKFGKMYAVSKIFEKYHRIITLSQNENKVKEESLEDALLDCIGYCVLYYDYLCDKDNKMDF